MRQQLVLARHAFANTGLHPLAHVHGSLLAGGTTGNVPAGQAWVLGSAVCWVGGGGQSSPTQPQGPSPRERERQGAGQARDRPGPASFLCLWKLLTRSFSLPRSRLFLSEVTSMRTPFDAQLVFEPSFSSAKQPPPQCLPGTSNPCTLPPGLSFSSSSFVQTSGSLSFVSFVSVPPPAASTGLCPRGEAVSRGYMAQAPRGTSPSSGGRQLLPTC